MSAHTISKDNIISFATETFAAMGEEANRAEQGNSPTSVINAETSRSSERRRAAQRRDAHAESDTTP